MTLERLPSDGLIRFTFEMADQNVISFVPSQSIYKETEPKEYLGTIDQLFDSPNGVQQSKKISFWNKQKFFAVISVFVLASLGFFGLRSGTRPQKFVGVYSAHDDATDAQDAAMVLEKQLESLPAGQVAFFFEFGGVQMNALLGDSETVRTGLTKEALFTGRATRAQLDSFKAVFHRAVDYNVQIYRQAFFERDIRNLSSFERGVMGVLLRNRDKIKHLLVEGDETYSREDRELYFKSALDYETASFQRDSILNSMTRERISPEEYLRVAKRALELSASSDIQRDKIFAKALKKIANEYPNDTIVFLRGTLHQISGVVRNELGGNIREAATALSYAIKPLDQAKTQIQKGVSVNDKQIEDLLLREIVFDYLLWGFLRLKKTDPRYPAMRNAVYEISEKSTVEDAKALLDVLPEFGKREREQGIPTFRSVFDWFKKRRPEFEKYGNLLSKVDESDKVYWAAADKIGPIVRHVSPSVSVVTGARLASASMRFFENKSEDNYSVWRLDPEMLSNTSLLFWGSLFLVGVAGLLPAIILFANNFNPILFGVLAVALTGAVGFYQSVKLNRSVSKNSLSLEFLRHMEAHSPHVISDQKNWPRPELLDDEYRPRLNEISGQQVPQVELAKLDDGTVVILGNGLNRYLLRIEKDFVRVWDAWQTQDSSFRVDKNAFMSAEIQVNRKYGLVKEEVNVKEGVLVGGSYMRLPLLEKNGAQLLPSQFKWQIDSNGEPVSWKLFICEPVNGVPADWEEAREEQVTESTHWEKQRHHSASLAARWLVSDFAESVIGRINRGVLPDGRKLELKNTRKQNGLISLDLIHGEDRTTLLEYNFHTHKAKNSLGITDDRLDVPWVADRPALSLMGPGSPLIALRFLDPHSADVYFMQGAGAFEKGDVSYALGFNESDPSSVTVSHPITIWSQKTFTRKKIENVISVAPIYYDNQDQLSYHLGPIGFTVVTRASDETQPKEWRVYLENDYFEGRKIRVQPSAGLVVESGARMAKADENRPAGMGQTLFRYLAVTLLIFSSYFFGRSREREGVWQILGDHLTPVSLPDFLKAYDSKKSFYNWDYSGSALTLNFYPQVKLVPGDILRVTFPAAIRDKMKDVKIIVEGYQKDKMPYRGELGAFIDPGGIVNVTVGFPMSIVKLSVDPGVSETLDQAEKNKTVILFDPRTNPERPKDSVMTEDVYQQMDIRGQLFHLVAPRLFSKKGDIFVFRFNPPASTDPATIIRYRFFGYFKNDLTQLVVSAPSEATTLPADGVIITEIKDDFEVIGFSFTDEPGQGQQGMRALPTLNTFELHPVGGARLADENLRALEKFIRLIESAPNWSSTHEKNMREAAVSYAQEAIQAINQAKKGAANGFTAKDNLGPIYVDNIHNGRDSAESLRSRISSSYPSSTWLAIIYALAVTAIEDLQKKMPDASPAADKNAAPEVFKTLRALVEARAIASHLREKIEETQNLLSDFENNSDEKKLAILSQADSAMQDLIDFLDQKAKSKNLSEQITAQTVSFGARYELLGNYDIKNKLASAVGMAQAALNPHFAGDRNEAGRDILSALGTARVRAEILINFLKAPNTELQKNGVVQVSSPSGAKFWVLNLWHKKDEVQASSTPKTRDDATSGARLAVSGAFHFNQAKESFLPNGARFASKTLSRAEKISDSDQSILLDLAASTAKGVSVLTPLEMSIESGEPDSQRLSFFKVEPTSNGAQVIFTANLGSKPEAIQTISFTQTEINARISQGNVRAPLVQTLRQTDTAQAGEVAVELGRVYRAALGAQKALKQYSLEQKGVVDTESSIALLIDPAVFGNPESENKIGFIKPQLEAAQKRGSVLGPEQIVVIGQGDVSIQTSKVVFITTAGNKNHREKLLKLLADSHVPENQRKALGARFALTLVPVEDQKDGYSALVLESLFAVARIIARVSPEALSTLPDKTQSFLSDRIAAVKDLGLKKVVEALQNFSDSLATLYSKLTVKVDRVLIDQMIKARQTALQFVGASA